jgi:hypothetical protein
VEQMWVGPGYQMSLKLSLAATSFLRTRMGPVESAVAEAALEVLKLVVELVASFVAVPGTRRSVVGRSFASLFAYLVIAVIAPELVLVGEQLALSLCTAGSIPR